MATETKIRESQGSAYERRGKQFLHITVAAQQRKSELAPWAVNREEALARAHVVQAWVNRLRAAGHDGFVEKIVEFGARATTPDELAQVATYVDNLTAGDFERLKPAKKPGTTTFGEFAYQWVRGELAAKYPDHVERKRSAYSDLCLLRKYVFPVVEHLPIAGVTLEHYEQVMREIPTRTKRKVRSATRRHVAQVMRRVMQLAEYPAKLVERNPIPANAMPKVKLEVALQYIYPDEDFKLLACTATDEAGKPKVDLGLRVLFGFLTRAGWRREEALGGKVEAVEEAVQDQEQALDEVPALTWRRLDLRHGIVRMDREKTGKPRPVPIDPDIVRAMKAWREVTPRPADDDVVFVEMSGEPIDRHEAADLLRAALLAAGQDREELHDTKSPFRRPVRLHDLRASMVTIAMANGRPEEWIRRRTGHTSSALERYRREAATLKELTLGDWLPLDQAIPELAAVRAARRGNGAADVSEGGSADASTENTSANTSAAPQKPTSGIAETSSDSAQSGRLDSNQRPLDPQSSALTRLRYAPSEGAT